MLTMDLRFSAKFWQVEPWMATGEILLGHNPPFTSVLFAYAGAHQIAEPEYLIIGFGVQLGG